MDLGLACNVCGQLNTIRSLSCGRCGAVLAPAPVFANSPVAAPAGARPGLGPVPGVAPRSAPAAAAPVAMTAPRAAVSPAPRFDPATGRPIATGEPAPDPRGAPKTMFFGALQQQPVVPRLVVIKGEGGDGATYHLQGTTTVIGRNNGEVTFPEDPFLSPQHAKFTTQQGRLFIQDLGSENGVFVRIKKPTPLEDGALFLVGEQLLRLESRPFSDGSPNADGTYFYGSPRPEGAFTIAQRLAGGGEGRISTAQGNCLTIGREGNHLDFPDDRFISGHHARLDVGSDDGRVVLTDTGSRNGTFVRIAGAQELFHGDYLFVGQQLLRVEIA